jgi:hypothetical protein
MELGSLLLLILLPPADAGSDLAAAVQAALYEDLGQVAIAVVSDDHRAQSTWQDRGGHFKARFVGRLVWKNSRTATVNLYGGQSKAAPSDLVKTRDVSFARGDSSRERGRAIGLVLVQLLRELPGVVVAKTPVEAAPVASAPVAVAPVATHPNAFIVDMYTEHVSTENWGLGPEITVAHTFIPALQVRGFGLALFGSQDSYTEFGAGAGVTWLFWRQAEGRRALGLEGDAGLCRGTVTTSGDGGGSHANVSGSFRAAATSYVHVSGPLFIGASIGIRALTSSLTYSFGDDSKTYRSHPLLRWFFTLGAGFSL